MFFWHRKKERECKKPLRRIIAGLIIGGAVASIVGKKLLEHREKEREEMEKDTEDDD